MSIVFIYLFSTVRKDNFPIQLHYGPFESVNEKNAFTRKKSTTLSCVGRL